MRTVTFLKCEKERRKKAQGKRGIIMRPVSGLEWAFGSVSVISAVLLSAVGQLCLYPAGVLRLQASALRDPAAAQRQYCKLALTTGASLTLRTCAPWTCSYHTMSLLTLPINESLQYASCHSLLLNLAKLELSSKPVFTPPHALNAEKASFSYV